MVGVDKHWIEKDLIKFLRKSFAMTDKKEDSVKETTTPSDELPLKGVAKKRGAAFAFLQFSDLEEKQAFSELFAFTVVPNKHYRIKEATNINLKRGFHQVKSAQEMNQDSIQRKEKRMAEVTQKDVDEVLTETIEQRVTPYGHLEYGEQLKKKHEWLRGVLGALGNSLDKEIKRGNEIAPAWYRQSKEMPLSDDIIHSDALEGYRNKVEFTVGYQYAPPRDGENELWSKGPVCVGFNRGNLAKGISFVEKPDSIKVNSAESLIAARKFERIVAESGLPPYDKSVNRGFWRILVYRESKVTKQVLICVVVSK